MAGLQNTRTGEILACEIEVASTGAARTLLGRERLDASTAVVVSPCCAVHTAFMRFPVDVAFLDREDTVVQIVADLAPWRVVVSTFAHTTIQFAAGTLRWRDIVVGDRLCLTPGVCASPRERSGDSGVPASERAEGPRGEAPGPRVTHPIIVWSSQYSA